MKSRLFRTLSCTLVALFGALTVPACVGDQAQEQDLTSLTARERLLTFEGYVYVHPDASDDDILAAVHHQTRSAFGALLTQNIAVGTREPAAANPQSFAKEAVEVLGPQGEVVYETLRVRYRYDDRAVIPKSMSHRGAIPLGLLHGDYPLQAARVIAECSANTKEELEMLDDVWYVFNPSLPSCRKAMDLEQRAIATQRLGLSQPESQIVETELDRLYIPMTARLSSPPSSRKTLYPEYDRLFRGGVQPGKLVISLLAGLIDHSTPKHPVHPADDPGYYEMLDTMNVVLEAHPALKITNTDPPTDLSTFQVNGKSVTGLRFVDFVNFELYDYGWPAQLSSSERAILRKLIAERLKDRWVTLEEQVEVSIDGGPVKAHTISLQLHFGADEAIGPYRRAIRESDVFLYNGHSYIGEGPLDPANYTAADFPQSYQLFFIDSCLSFNYYNSDYFRFKQRGTKDLDVITNA
ncbi:MAG: hypothetical protein VB934_16820, partial [Polyangiaceae bacterium]